MSELIKTIINVKDPFALLAFISVVLLLAFKTKAVPELFFGLLKDKLTKERFSHLLHRFMLLGFGSFILLCGLAVIGQILAHKAEAKPMTIEDFRTEIQSLKSAPNQEALQQATKAYEEGMSHIDRKEFDQAIKSLQDSISKIPTLSAEYTLAYLYQKAGDAENAKKHAKEASLLAQTRGSSFDSVKVDKLSKEIETQDNTAGANNPSNGNNSLIGPKTELPEVGDSFENAHPISPGSYIHNAPNWGAHYFKLTLKKDQVLTIKFRTPESGAHAMPKIFDKDGGGLKQGDAWGNSIVSLLEWKALEDGTYYINFTEGAPGTVYLISIQ